MDYHSARYRDLANHCGVIARETTHKETQDALHAMAEEFDAEGDRLKALARPGSGEQDDVETRS